MRCTASGAGVSNRWGWVENCKGVYTFCFSLIRLAVSIVGRKKDRRRRSLEFSRHTEGALRGESCIRVWGVYTPGKENSLHGVNNTSSNNAFPAFCKEFDPRSSLPVHRAGGFFSQVSSCIEVPTQLIRLVAECPRTGEEHWVCFRSGIRADDVFLEARWTPRETERKSQSRGSALAWLSTCRVCGPSVEEELRGPAHSGLSRGRQRGVGGRQERQYEPHG